jgi:mercuric ion transport protein
MNTSQNTPIQEPRDRKGLVATGGVVGAILASACCIGPLVLVTLGISGAWIGTLTKLEPYKPYVAAITLGILAIGFWQVYFTPKKDCAEDSYCANPKSTLITQIALWAATVLVIAALTIDYWAPLFY